MRPIKNILFIGLVALLASVSVCNASAQSKHESKTEKQLLVEPASVCAFEIVVVPAYQVDLPTTVVYLYQTGAPKKLPLVKPESVFAPQNRTSYFRRYNLAFYSIDTSTFVSNYTYLNQIRQC